MQVELNNQPVFRFQNSRVAHRRYGSAVLKDNAWISFGGLSGYGEVKADNMLSSTEIYENGIFNMGPNFGRTLWK